MAEEVEVLSVSYPATKAFDFDYFAYVECIDKREDALLRALEHAVRQICDVDRYFMGGVKPVRPVLPRTVTVRIPERLYKVYRKLAAVAGVRLDFVIVGELLKYGAGIMDAYKAFKISYESIFEITEDVYRRLPSKLRKGRDYREDVKTFGELVTVIEDNFGIPEEGITIDLDTVEPELKKVIEEKVNKLKPVWELFGIEVMEVEGRIKQVRITERSFSIRFYGIGTKLWSEPLACKERVKEVEEGRKIPVTINFQEIFRVGRVTGDPETVRSMREKLETLMLVLGKRIEDIIVDVLEYYEETVRKLDRFFMEYARTGRVKPTNVEAIRAIMELLRNPDFAILSIERPEIADIIWRENILRFLPTGEVTITVTVPGWYRRVLEKALLVYKAGDLARNIPETVERMASYYLKAWIREYSDYELKYLRLVSATRRLIDEAVARRLIPPYDPVKAIELIGKFVAIAVETFGDLPDVIEVNRIRDVEWRRMANVIEEVVGERVDDPRTYFVNLIREIKVLAPVFRFYVVEREGEVEAVRMFDRLFMIRFIYYGTKLLNEIL